MFSLTSLTASCLLSEMMGAEPLVQESLRNEPLAEQERTTVLLKTLAWMVTSESGSAGGEEDIQILMIQCQHFEGGTSAA